MIERLRLARTARFWGRVAAGDRLVTWLCEPAVRRYVNACVTGDPNVWPIDGLASRLGHPGHAISLGCGDGMLDRQLRERGICDSLEGVDISSKSLQVARLRAEEQGLTGMEYALGDLNRLALEPGSCDLAVFQQSLHHVADLEGCLGEVRKALRARGLVYLDEYVGPSRSEWSRCLLRKADEIFQALPRSIRRRRRLQLPVDRGDPSEAIRSSEIVREISARFEVELRRDYGGTFLSVIFPHLDLDALAASQREEVLELLIEAERRAVSEGAPAYYTVIMARKTA